MEQVQKVAKNFALTVELMVWKHRHARLLDWPWKTICILAVLLAHYCFCWVFMPLVVEALLPHAGHTLEDYFMTTLASEKFKSFVRLALLDSGDLEGTVFSIEDPATMVSSAHPSNITVSNYVKTVDTFIITSMSSLGRH